MSHLLLCYIMLLIIKSSNVWWKKKRKMMTNETYISNSWKGKREVNNAEWSPKKRKEQLIRMKGSKENQSFRHTLLFNAVDTKHTHTHTRTTLGSLSTQRTQRVSTPERWSQGESVSIYRLSPFRHTHVWVGSRLSRPSCESVAMTHTQTVMKQSADVQHSQSHTCTTDTIGCDKPSRPSSI